MFLRKPVFSVPKGKNGTTSFGVILRTHKLGRRQEQAFASKSASVECLEPSSAHSDRRPFNIAVSKL